MLAALLALLLIVPVRAAHGVYMWPRGIAPHARLMGRIGGEEPCAWTLGAWDVPWTDVLPVRALNFWTGSQDCTPEPASRASPAWSVTYEARLLTVHNCRSVVTYRAFPDTRGLSLHEKDFKIFPNTVFRLMQTLHNYSAPVRLGDSAEAVIVYCGASRKIAIDVIPTKSPFEASNSGSARSPTPNAPNVLLLFVDSVSRRHFLRRLPRLVSHLAKFARPSHSAASDAPTLFEFFRYHLTHFATDENTRAIYTGSWIANTGEAALPTLWELFHRAGYATMRTESNCEDWSVQYARAVSSQYLSHELMAHACHPDVYDLNGHPHGNFKGMCLVRAMCVCVYVCMCALPDITMLCTDSRLPHRPLLYRGALSDGSLRARPQH